MRLSGKLKSHAWRAKFCYRAYMSNVDQLSTQALPASAYCDGVLGLVQVHYNSVFPQAEPPAPLPPDKTLGSRRLHHLLHREVY